MRTLKLRRGRDRDPNRSGHPIIAGVVAFVAVTAVVGAIMGGGALAATRVLGLGDEATTARDNATSSETLYIPAPTRTEPTDDPFITLGSDPTDSSSTGATTSPSPTIPTEPATTIDLTAAERSVSPMGRIDLSVTYPGGEGAVLQVQQFSEGAWSDFPVTVAVTGQPTTTYIQTGQVGLNKLRVTDTDTGETSNVVKVTVG